MIGQVINNMIGSVVSVSKYFATAILLLIATLALINIINALITIICGILCLMIDIVKTKSVKLYNSIIEWWYGRV